MNYINKCGSTKATPNVWVTFVSLLLHSQQGFLVLRGGRPRSGYSPNNPPLKKKQPSRKSKMKMQK